MSKSIKLVSTELLKSYLLDVKKELKNEIIDLKWRDSNGEFELMKGKYFGMLAKKKGEYQALWNMVRIINRLESEPKTAQ